jgi:tol-pal system protein YbgF
MLTAAYLPKSLPAMIRFSLIFVAVFSALGAASVRAQDSPTDLVMRIDHLEATIRNLTGNIEQLQYRNQQLEQQIQHLQAELQGGAPAAAAPPLRPTTQYSPPAAVSPQAVAAAPPVALPASPRPQYSPPPAAPTPAIAAVPIAPPAVIEATPPSTTRRGDAFDPSANPNAPGAPRPLGASTAATEPPPPIANTPSTAGQRQIGSPLELSTSPPTASATARGELPAPPPVNTSATGATLATLPPGNTARDEYDLAYGYVLHRDYSLAADAFRVFLRQYPSDRLAPEALYWLGESLFQQQQYRDAAESFLAVSTKYDTTARAPEALLRLGESLAALGEKEAACASLGEVLRKYPRAPSNIKQTVLRDQKRGHC